MHIPNEPVREILFGILEKATVVIEKIVHAPTLHHPNSKDLTHRDMWDDFLEGAKNESMKLRLYRNMPSRIKVPLGALSPEQAAFSLALSSFLDEEVKIPLLAPNAPPLDLPRLLLHVVSRNLSLEDEVQWEQCSQLLVADPSLSNTVRSIYASYLLPLVEAMAEAGELRRGEELSLNDAVKFMESFAAKRKEFRVSDHVIERVKLKREEDKSESLVFAKIELVKDADSPFKLYRSISEVRHTISEARTALQRFKADPQGDESIKAMPRLAVMMLRNMARSVNISTDSKSEPILCDTSVEATSPLPLKADKLSSRQTPAMATAGPSSISQPYAHASSSSRGVFKWENSRHLTSLLSSARTAVSKHVRKSCYVAHLTTRTLVDHYIEKLRAAGAFKKGSSWRGVEGGEEDKDFVFWTRPCQNGRGRNGGYSRKSRASGGRGTVEGEGAGGGARKGKTPAPRCGTCSYCINVATGKQACFPNRERIESGQKPVFMDENKEKEFVARYGKLWEKELWKEHQG